MPALAYNSEPILPSPSGQERGPCLMIQCLENLFVGNARDASNLDELRRLGITHMVNCATEVDCYFEGLFSYFRLPSISPDQAFRKQVARACAFVDTGRKTGKVLIHCSAGSVRAPAMTVAYLWHTGRSVAEAIEALAAIGKSHPDTRFVRLLEQWELRGTMRRPGKTLSRS